jgi:hypothetical protein
MRRKMTRIESKGVRATIKDTDGSIKINENNSDCSFDADQMDGSLISKSKSYTEFCKKMGMREYDNGTVLFYEDEYDNK